MSVSGYGGGIAPEEFEVDSAVADESAAAPQQTGVGAPASQADVGRGAGPTFMPDAGASMLAASLGEQVDAAEIDAVDAQIAKLEDQLIDRTIESFTAESVSDVEAIDAEIAELEARLMELYAYRDELEAQIMDPGTSYWDAFWLEWDLADTECEIAELENQLGRLEDALFEELLNDFLGWSDVWKDAMSFAFDTRKAVEAELEQNREAQGKRLRDLQDILRKADARLEAERADHERDLRSAQQEAADKAKLQALRPPAPARTPETRQELERLLSEAAELKQTDRAEALKHLREGIRELRAAR